LSLQFNSEFDGCNSSFVDCTEATSCVDWITAFDVEGIDLATLVLETTVSFFFIWFNLTLFVIVLLSLQALGGLVMESLACLIVLKKLT